MEMQQNTEAAKCAVQINEQMQLQGYVKISVHRALQ